MNEELTGLSRIVAFGDHGLLGYFGPGGGLTALGALLGIVVGVIAALFGFVWYPLKRLLRGNHETGTKDVNGTPT